MSHLPRLSSETITVSPPPMQRSTLLSGPWIDIAADLLGPMPSGEHLLKCIHELERLVECRVHSKAWRSVCVNGCYVVTGGN